MRALLDTDGLDGVVDAVRLAVIVLASRTPSETGEVEIRTGELARWLGLSKSYVASVVIPALRRSGLVKVDTREGEVGEDTGLRCRVLPMWAAHGMVGHPLNLTKKELATLLRLLEAVMAPGWTHRDGRVTPAGLVGARTGRGAATDRLALLLLVLEAGETGRVRLCGGTVDTKRGRLAATVARLLGCTISAGEQVLERLEERNLVRRVRLQTASGLAHRSRLMVPAVAAAHGGTVADDGQEDRGEALEPEFSDPDVAAGPVQAPDLATEPQVSGVLVTDKTDVAEPDVAAALHTDHPHLVTPLAPLQLSGGFSGEGRGAEGRRPERACVRENQAARGEGSAPATGSPVAEGGPLRGEKPHNPLSRHIVDSRGAVITVPTDAAGGARQHRGVPLLPQGLTEVLAPVRALWQRLERGGARSRVVQVVRAEVNRAAFVVGAQDAPRVVADRLARRLAAQGGPARVADPVGWLLGRGLPRRPSCTDVRCDEGTRMDTGTVCELCEVLIADRQTLRQAAAAEVAAAMPAASASLRRAEIERRLAHITAEQITCTQRRHDRDAVERQRREAARAQASAGTVAAHHAPVASPCAGCRSPEADPVTGFCASCEADARELLRPEMEPLNAEGQRLFLRLVGKGDEQDGRARAWACTVPACGRRQVGVPARSGMCAPCERKQSGQPSPLVSSADAPPSAVPA
ncbi:hypothetical protein [Streptomyces sp. NPDC018031]|uniref:hypothetical protein n=1 Tax=Streptomyces sp. NPDC018031 TaxID=3365033 RepID=UPI0037B0C9A5